MDDLTAKRWRLLRGLDAPEPPDGFDRALQRLGNAAWEVLALRDLLPFQSVNRLCFDAGDRPYDRPMGGFISFDAYGGFAVHRGSPYPDAETRMMLETTEPDVAVAELLRVFGWL